MNAGASVHSASSRSGTLSDLVPHFLKLQAQILYEVIHKH